MAESWDAVVVGSGPNGLAAAITIADAGRSVVVLEAAETVGGALRSDRIGPGLTRDLGAAVMPFAIGSPFFARHDLGAHGLRWASPEVHYTHPLDGGRAGAALSSVEATAELLGSDGDRYRRIVAPLADRWFDLMDEIQRPIARVPRHPLLLARYGLRGMLPVTRVAARFDGDEAPAMLAGCAAHGVLPLTAPFTGAFATLFAASAHAHGWPVAVGGSQAVADALASKLESLGGTIRCGHPVSSVDDLPPHRAALFDVGPGRLDQLAGHRFPSRYRRRIRRFRHGPGIFKIDHVLDGPVPWADPHSRRTATVHVGGTLAEVRAAEAEVTSGGHPERPFVLVAQQGVADASRNADNATVLWSYTHVPNGSTVDRTEAIERQIERFAPGFRDRILERHVTDAAGLEARNPNHVGGDIAGGSYSGAQLFVRPRLLHPYRTPDATVFLCSASTPPGGGVHGMPGYNAARAALASTLR